MTCQSEPAAPTATALLARLGYACEGAVVNQLAHNPWLSAGVWSVRMAAGREAVLKYVRSDRPRGETPWEAHWSARDQDPRRWTYWAREPLAYENNLTSAFSSGGIEAPARLASLLDDREAVLLLERVEGEPGERWVPDSFATAAEALGVAQASYLVGQTFPDFPWLTRSFLREYSTEKPVDWDLLHDDEAWHHPLVRETFPAGLREGATLLHAQRERLYVISESLPRTLCHLDFWPKNLFRRSDSRITLIDWSFVGLGSIGEDIGNIVPDSSLDHFVAADDLPQLEHVVFDGYLNGLRAGGWTDDPRLIRLGMWASAVKYDWMTPFTLAQTGQEKHYLYGGGGEIDARYKFSERSRVLLFLATWARQALELAEQLGL